MRPFLVIALLAVAGCAAFNAPTPDQDAADRVACGLDRWCRWLDPRPGVLVNAAIDARAPSCTEAADKAAAILRARGVKLTMRTAYVPASADEPGAKRIVAGMPYMLHEYIEAEIDGATWGVDPNDRLPFCNRVCTADEARHGTIAP